MGIAMRKQEEVIKTEAGFCPPQLSPNKRCYFFCEQ